MSENIGITPQTLKALNRLIGDLAHMGAKIEDEFANDAGSTAKSNTPMASDGLHMQYLRFRHKVTQLPKGERDFIERVITPEYEAVRTPKLSEWCTNNYALPLNDAACTVSWAASALILMGDNSQSLMRHFMLAARSVDIYNTAYTILMGQYRNARQAGLKPPKKELLEAHLVAKKYRQSLSNTFAMMRDDDKDKLDNNLAYVMEDQETAQPRELLNTAMEWARSNNDPLLSAQGGMHLYQASLLHWPDIAKFKRLQIGYY